MSHYRSFSTFATTNTFTAVVDTTEYDDDHLHHHGDKSPTMDRYQSIVGPMVTYHWKPMKNQWVHGCKTIGTNGS